MMNRRVLLPATLLLALSSCEGGGDKTPAPLNVEGCSAVVEADVVALDQPFFYNRLGANQAGGMVYALQGDVVSTDPSSKTLSAGKVALRQDKRPRPLVLRVNEGDCLKVNFTNLLADPAVTYPSSVTKGDWWEIVNPSSPTAQPSTRAAGFHAMGMSVVAAYDATGAEIAGIQGDGAFVGVNAPGIVNPGGQISYLLRAEQEGTYLAYSTGSAIGDNNQAGQLTEGLFGAVNVEPRGSVWIRSQVSQADLKAATTGTSAKGQPLVDYNKLLIAPGGKITHSDLTAIIAWQDPKTGAFGDFPAEKGGNNGAADPLFGTVAPSPDRNQPFREITTIYHEAYTTSQAFACAYTGPTGDPAASTCDPNVTGTLDPYLSDATRTVVDQFAINYASGGIGSEILSNRLGVGSSGECIGCKYEEFFLSSWALGDPGQVVTTPADPSIGSGLATVKADNGVWYPDDPSNVYHSYLQDHVKFRVLHGGAALHHIHHQHAQQWLHTPNSPDGHYLDSQAIGPGSGYTLEMVYNGSGNRNLTVGDSIFHCHFYPHFAQGMWALWRVHDVFETGTTLDGSGFPAAAVWNEDGTLATPGARALPDAEFTDGSAIPALVPLPSRPLPPMPGMVTLSQDGKSAVPIACATPGSGGSCSKWEVLETSDELKQANYQNPGFPFFIPGVAGQRAPRPPLDVPLVKSVKNGANQTELQVATWQGTSSGGGSWSWQGQTVTAGQDGWAFFDGGLPRHLMTGPDPYQRNENGGVVITDGVIQIAQEGGGPVVDQAENRWDFHKIVEYATADLLNEQGEPLEQVAMAFHAQDGTPSCTWNGKTSTCTDAIDFALNGLPPAQGAPLADPCDQTRDQWNGYTRVYQGANIQLDVVFNKEGWHFPQERLITLWQDVGPTMNKKIAPEPFFIRANSRDCVQYTQVNLVPSEYLLDDWQVRTPTDILGQHIHLVKFDVTSSDGAANGFNYEDGTLSPDEVRERIDAINKSGGLAVGSGTTTCPDGQPATGGKCTMTEQIPPNVFGFDESDADWAKTVAANNWGGAMASMQRWMVDPLITGEGEDQTLRTVFTHDHYGPSTHQQVGLYAGLLIEPEGSLWVDMSTGLAFGGAANGNVDCETAIGQTTGTPITAAGGFTCRSDGGPTSWRANIITTDPQDSYREFTLEFQDVALMYPPGTSTTPSAYSGTSGCDNYAQTESFANPSAFSTYGVPGTAKGANDKLSGDVQGCPNCTSARTYFSVPTGGNAGVKAPSTCGPWPGGIVASGQGMELINYRNEPLDARVANKDGSAPKGSGGAPGSKAAPQQANSHVFSSNYARPYAAVNGIGTTYPSGSEQGLTPGVQPTDPYTPMFQAFEGDQVQIRTLVGAHLAPHAFTTRGPPWLYEPSEEASGYRATQVMGISEHYEMNFSVPPNPAELSATSEPFADYLYMTDASIRGFAAGAWGIIRSYDLDEAQAMGAADVLQALPNNPGRTPSGRLSGAGYCDPARPVTPATTFNVYALAVSQFVADQAAIIYTFQNNATAANSGANESIVDTEGLVYVLADDVTQDTTSKLWSFVEGRTFEPLVLRATAGDCIQVTLTNQFDVKSPSFTRDTKTDAGLSADQVAAFQSRVARNFFDFTAMNALAFLQTGYEAPSVWAGLYAQGVSADPYRSAGYDVGFNASGANDVSPNLAEPGQSVTYTWYAGRVDYGANNNVTYTPVEFGTANLLPADPIDQGPHGLYGALIIEPAGATWQTDAFTRLTATVTVPGQTPFREFVLVFQENLAGANSIDGTTGKAINYGMSFLQGNTDEQDQAWQFSDAYTPGPPGSGATAMVDYAQVVGGNAVYSGEPPTTLLVAHAGQPVRIRVAHPDNGQNQPPVFSLSGHGWQEEPYVVASNCGGVDCFDGIAQTIGVNPDSQWMGSMMGVGSASHYDFVLAPTPLIGGSQPYTIENGAGGTQSIAGDYLLRTFETNGFYAGQWTIFRVGPEVGGTADVLAITSAQVSTSGELQVIGRSSPVLGAGDTDAYGTVTLYSGGLNTQGTGCDTTTTLGQAATTYTYTATVGTTSYTVNDQRSLVWSFTQTFTSPATPPTAICAQSSKGGYFATTVPSPALGG